MELTYFSLSITTSLLLFSLSLIHIYWGLGGLWPGKNKQELIDLVFGKGNQFPSAFSCFFVAVFLILFSILPIVWIYRVPFLIHPQMTNGIRYIMYFVAIVFTLRGVIGYLPFVTKHWKPIFVYYTKRIYNPLCLFLGLVFWGMAFFT